MSEDVAMRLLDTQSNNDNLASTIADETQNSEPKDDDDDENLEEDADTEERSTSSRWRRMRTLVILIAALWLAFVMFRLTGNKKTKVIYANRWATPPALFTHIILSVSFSLLPLSLGIRKITDSGLRQVLLLQSSWQTVVPEFVAQNLLYVQRPHLPKNRKRGKRSGQREVGQAQSQGLRVGDKEYLWVTPFSPVTHWD